MALEKNIPLDILSNGETTTSYINIPRTIEDGFFNFPDPKQYVFPVNFWMSEQARKDYRTDKTKKPAKTVTVRMLNCTQEDIDGTEGVEATYSAPDPITGNIEMLTPAIPAKVGLKYTQPENTFVCSYDTVIDDNDLDTYVHAHMLDIVEGSKLGMEKAKILGIVTQFYPYMKTVTDFCGENMTLATDIPPVTP